MFCCFLKEFVSFACSDEAVKLLLHLSCQRMKMTLQLRWILTEAQTAGMEMIRRGGCYRRDVTSKLVCLNCSTVSFQKPQFMEISPIPTHRFYLFVKHREQSVRSGERRKLAVN